MIFAATEVGPYLYLAEDNYWYDIAGSSAPDQTYWCVEWIPETQTARFGTYGRGIWDFKVEKYTSIESNSKEKHSNEFAISLSPNPFNEIVNIIISSEKDIDAEISIYDLDGRKVKSFNNINLSKGRNIIIWDGTNDNGVQMPTGNYIVILNSLGRIIFKTVKLIR
jgi:hypothetical protein